ncbi:hypothetical protein AWE93_25795, partial [Escherichia coli]
LFYNRCPLVEKVGTYVTNTGLMATYSSRFTLTKNWSQFQIFSSIYFPIRSAVIHRYIHEAGVHYKSVCVN